MQHDQWLFTFLDALDDNYRESRLLSGTPLATIIRSHAFSNNYSLVSSHDLVLIGYFQALYAGLYGKTTESNPYAAVSQSQTVYKILCDYTAVKLESTNPDLKSCIEQLQNDFTDYMDQMLSEPVKMVDAESFADATHYIFFEHLHIRLRDDALLPEIKLVFDDYTLDLTESQAHIFEGFPVFLGEDEPIEVGMLNLTHFMFYIFLHKQLKQNINLLYAVHILDYDEVMNTCKKDLDHLYSSRENLVLLRKVMIKSKQLDFDRLYMESFFVTWDEHVETCRYVEAHRELLERWRQYDLRAYYCLIRNRQRDLSFNQFSPAYLCRKYRLYDKRSARTLMKLDDILFTLITDSMMLNRVSHMHSFILHWMSYTTKNPNPQTHIVRALCDHLEITEVFETKLLFDYPHQCVHLMDLMYERILQLSGGQPVTRTNLGEYVMNDMFMTQFVEYLHFLQPEDPQEIRDRNVETFTHYHHGSFSIRDLSKIHTSSTLASIQRKIDAWHAEALLKELDFHEYPIRFEPVQYDGYTFEALKDTHDLIQERILMQHCIANYHPLIIKREYVCFKVSSDTERATLGLNIISINGEICNYHYNQCFGRQNQPISESMKAAVSRFIENIHQHQIGTEINDDHEQKSQKFASHQI